MIVLISRKKTGIDEDHHDDSGQDKINNMVGFVQGILLKFEM